MHLLPVPPQTQALSSSTFRVPPLDGSLTLIEMIDWHAEHTPEHPFCVYRTGDGTMRELRWPEVAVGIYQGCKIIRDRMNWKQGTESCVVGILSPSETISYWSTLMSVIRAGYSVFPISPRNSARAVAHLMKQAGVKHLLVGKEHAMVLLAEEALRILANDSDLAISVQTSSMLDYEELFSGSPVKAGDVPYFRERFEDIVMYLHSSGSTAFPKLIPLTSRRLIEIALIPWYGERDITGSVFSTHSVPMFHGLGLFFLSWGISVGSIAAVYEPRRLPLIPTPDSVIKEAKEINCDYIFTVPSFVEAWSRNPEYVNWLSTCKGVIYGGGPMSETVGDYLNSQGVAIFTSYGSNEAGVMSVILTNEVHKDWQYMKLSRQQEIVMVPHGDNTFELVVVASEIHRPSIINYKVDGRDAYSTSDLLVPHPETPGYWRIFGRADDQIMHSTGEKTNPGPLEHIVDQDPHVGCSVVFGRGRFNAGIILELKPEFRFDPSDQHQVAEWRNKIWPSIQKANDYAPQHSRIFKEMIMFTKPSKPFSYTAKNTPRRHAIIADYAEEIDHLYTAAEESTQSQIPAPETWDVDETKHFVRAAVSKVLTKKVGDNDDLFESGCDSLQATWIRNTLLNALRISTHLNVRNISESFVYNHPTIAGLATFIHGLVAANGSELSSEEELSQKLREMKEMVERYAQNFPSHTGTAEPEGNVVFLTGSTGGLGCHILAKLVENEEIRRVYAVNRRAKDSSITDRQRTALVENGLDPAIVENVKVVLLEADVNATNFGLEPDLYQKMSRTVTHIIHNAWRVNFNLALSSFEPNVKSVRSLVDFVLASPLAKPPKILFTSSIGVLDSSQDPEPLPERPVDAQVAAASGYVESKWAGEQILSRVSLQTPVQTTSVRVGQLCGGPNGAWHVNEWFPSLVQSATVLGCLPSDEMEVDWIPSDIAALAIIDFILSAKQQSMLHLVHPRPVQLSSIAKLMAKKLSVKIVSYGEWLQKLEAAAQAGNTDSLQEMPALKLLPTYRGMANNKGGQSFGLAKLDTRHAQECSATLADEHIVQLGEAQVDAWTGYWKRKQFLK